MRYTKENIESVFDSIIEKIEQGIPIRKILSEPNYPQRKTFYGWLKDDENKITRYARAKELYQDEIFEEMIIISNTPVKEIKTIERPNGTEIITSDSPEHRKLQIETRKWILGKLNPKKYGDKLDLTTGGEQVQQVFVINGKEIVF